MADRCDICDFRNDDVLEEDQRKFLVCDYCGRAICNECLKEMAAKYELTAPRAEADAPNAEELFIFRTASSEEGLCGECYARQERP